MDEGGRTGLTALVVAGMFIVALFFEPVIAMVGSYPAITAPALVIVGTMMIQNVVGITWGDFTEALPAFLIIVGIPLTFSVGDGLALGFIAYPLVKLLAGRGNEAGWTMWGLAAVLVAYFIFVRAKLGG